MAVMVKVPRGMGWCVDGRQTVPGNGASVRELWQDLSERYPELMWWLSTEAGAPCLWARVVVDGKPIERRQGLDTKLQADSVVALYLIEGAAPAAGIGTCQRPSPGT